MTKRIIIMVISFIPFLCFARDWLPIGQDTVSVKSGYSIYRGSVLCLTDGLMIHENSAWTKYSYGGLPVWDAKEIHPDSLLIIMGEGTYSDGVYIFNFNSLQFEIVEWCLNPNFLYYNCTTQNYYVGSDWGLLSSQDGKNWENVDFFDDKKCLTMSSRHNYLVVSVSGDTSGISISDDNGNSWSPLLFMPATDFRFDYNGTLFGIFPNAGWSSGLWMSNDYGEHWDNEFYSTNMSALGYTDNKLFISWHDNDGVNEGVAVWNPGQKKLTFLNDGLPCKRINNIVENQFIDCTNITVCTDSGAFCTCDFPVGIQNTEVIPNTFYIVNYPNPFNSITVFKFELPERSFTDLSIFNIQGQLIRRLVNRSLNSGAHLVKWNAGDSPSGIYIYRISAGKYFHSGKCMFLK